MLPIMQCYAEAPTNRETSIHSYCALLLLCWHNTHSTAAHFKWLVKELTIKLSHFARLNKRKHFTPNFSIKSTPWDLFFTMHIYKLKVNSATES